MEDTEIEHLLGRAPRVTIDDIIAHPRLPEARKVYLDRFLEVYGGDPFLVRLLLESGRFVVHLIVLLLEAAQDPARRETWATVGLLKQKMALFGFASDRQVDQLISRLCEVGYMELKPSQEDRRVRILKTTEKMREHDRDWMVAHFAPLTVLYPQHDYALVMQRDPEFQVVFRRVCVALLPLAAKVMASLPETMLFFERAAGVMVISALLQDALAQEDPAKAMVPYTDVGDRFGVSRTHVRKLLLAAQEAGLVKLHARGGRRVEILPRLWATNARGIACGMYLNDAAYLAATRQRLAPTARALRSRTGN